jgi:hypothetical protein
LSADFRRLESKVDIHLKAMEDKLDPSWARWNPNSKCIESSSGNDATSGLTSCCRSAARGQSIAQHSKATFTSAVVFC